MRLVMPSLDLLDEALIEKQTDARKHKSGKHQETLAGHACMLHACMWQYINT